MKESHRQIVLRGGLLMWLLAALSCVVLSGCRGGGSDAVVEEAAAPVISGELESEISEDDARAIAAGFEYLMSTEERGETVFLALKPIDPVSGAPLAPPAAVFEALAELEVDLVMKPASAATITFDPVNDMARPNRQVLDTATGQASTIYWVNIVKETEKNQRKIEAGGFRSYQNSWGFLATVEKRGRRWQVVEQYGKWQL